MGFDIVIADGVFHHLILYTSEFLHLYGVCQVRQHFGACCANWFYQQCAHVTESISRENLYFYQNFTSTHSFLCSSHNGVKTYSYFWVQYSNTILSSLSWPSWSGREGCWTLPSPPWRGCRPPPRWGSPWPGCSAPPPSASRASSSPWGWGRQRAPHLSFSKQARKAS